MKTWTIALLLTGAVTAAHAQTTTMSEMFLHAWPKDAYNAPNNGTFRINGNWCVPYGGKQCVELTQSLSAQAAFNNTHGLFTLTVPAGQYAGAEIQTTPGWSPDGVKLPFGPSKYGYGYYETKMKPSCVQGEISSMFWIQAPKYGPLEWDIEFPNPPGHTFTDVHWTLHPSNQTLDYQLGFNPCLSFHRYGFLWTPGTITFTVDGVARKTFNDSSLNSTATGFLMANAWTGNPNWGGGPPNATAVNQYYWIKYTAGAVSIPKN